MPIQVTSKVYFSFRLASFGYASDKNKTRSDPEYKTQI